MLEQPSPQQILPSTLPPVPWDVAVVGAGPSGCIAAINLSSAGYRVLLLDRAAFPREKVCGDGLIADSLGCLRRVGLYDRVSSLAHHIAMASVYSPSRIEIEIPGEYLTLKRLTLDAVLADEATNRGTIFCQGQVNSIQPKNSDHVLIGMAGLNTPITARAAILATGADISLLEGMGQVREPRHSAIALRCYLRSECDLNRLIVSYDRSIIPGYAWIFPMKGGVFNIGCGYFLREGDKLRVNLRAMFDRFTRDFTPAVRLLKGAELLSPLRGAKLRCGLTWRPEYLKGTILTCGEAAGATFPFTGEGIGKAMETGEIAAAVLGEYLASNDLRVLETYPRRLREELEPRYVGYRIAQKWLSKAWLNDFMAKRINRSRALHDAVVGVINETDDPKSIFSLKGIMKSFWR